LTARKLGALQAFSQVPKGAREANDHFLANPGRPTVSYLGCRGEGANRCWQIFTSAVAGACTDHDLWFLAGGDRRAVGAAPERKSMPLVGGIGVLTLCSGLLGTSVGMINTFRYVQSLAPDKQLEVALLGCAESLNNLVLALLLMVLTALLAIGGAVRVLRAA
jgi:hypothetical protein